MIQLRSLGYEVMVVSPDSISFVARRYKGEKNIDLALRIATVERAMMIRNLTRVGIPVVNWQVDRSLDDALHNTVNLLVKKQHILQVTK